MSTNSNQINCIVSCPLSTYSGYGRRSLDFVKELIRIRPDWNIKILSTDWGHSKTGYLEDNNEQDIISRIIDSFPSNEEPDVWIQIALPGEFTRRGKYNIGVTALIETTLCIYDWVDNCGKMDLVLVSSKHGQAVLENSRAEYKGIFALKGNSKPFQKSPVEILFEGIDLKKFYIPRSQSWFKELDSILITDWNFLCMGQWLPGDYGEDRKNIGYTIGTFLDTFKDTKNAPGLVLKVNGLNDSEIDRYEIVNKIQIIQDSIKYKESLPPIYLLHGELSDRSLNTLYNDPRIKAMVSFTKGEGFGRSLMEFASLGKPVICSGWSGPTDFLSTKHSAIVGGSLEYVHPSASNNYILQNAYWFTPDTQQAVFALQNMYSNYDYWKSLATTYIERIPKKYSLQRMGERLSTLLSRYFNI